MGKTKKLTAEQIRVQEIKSDALGRKVATIIMSATCIATFLLFFIGGNQFWNPYVVGFFAGATVRSFWAAGDIFNLMIAESTPTNVRSSVTGIIPILSGIIYFVFMLAFMVLMNVMGDARIGMLCLVFAVPGMAVSLIITWLKVKETKGADLGNIRGDEYEQ